MFVGSDNWPTELSSVGGKWGDSLCVIQEQRTGTLDGG